MGEARAELSNGCGFTLSRHRVQRVAEDAELLGIDVGGLLEDLPHHIVRFPVGALETGGGANSRARVTAVLNAAIRMIWAKGFIS